MRVSQAGRSRQLALVEDSPLRHADPRTKLFLSLAVSLVVMTSIERLLIFLAVYVLFLLWARLMIPTLEHIWRLKWVLILLFLFDWWMINLDHAILICLRLILLTGVFALFFSTTNTRELGLALEKLRVPYRYAFSLSLAFQSLGLLDDEWRAIREAQSSRGALPNVSSFWKFITNVGDLISLTVPAIVLTTKRAWAITEASYARGFDSPHRVSYHSLSFTRLDFLLMTGTIILLILLFWR
ncbi:MAG: energy-coupling factor transporter transmembrane protein EcfT [Anaerolineales bacterium]|nr:energy-coupling factor transporter transmembrane protein EcfT [Anaerolineales bacterium]